MPAPRKPMPPMRGTKGKRVPKPGAEGPKKSMPTGKLMGRKSSAPPMRGKIDRQQKPMPKYS